MGEAGDGLELLPLKRKGEVVVGTWRKRQGHSEIPPIECNGRIPAIPAENLAFLCHRYLKASSPQTPLQDNEIIATTFWNY
jgi:hypothetical protein